MRPAPLALRTFDQAYVDHLLDRAAAFPKPLRLHLLAFDHAYTSDGRIDLGHSEFYVPNEAVWAVAERHPDRIVPVMSIHPARPDALQELDRWADRGGRYLKWLPNAQGIDPADPRWDAFYRRMAERGVVLLSHAGEEKAVHAEAAQKLGNPLLFDFVLKRTLKTREGQRLDPGIFTARAGLPAGLLPGR